VSQTQRKEIAPATHNAPPTHLAVAGWIVVAMIPTGGKTDAVFFAVATHAPEEAEKAVHRYPGIVPSDARSALRQLSAPEISKLGLRPGGVRPFDRRAELPATIGDCRITVGATASDGFFRQET